ncbi:MAG: hypothetical protein IAF02_08335, partial [Anaerolineae bacterium]|nr:hypothetical protein [Anaerolineae bacterium]
AVGQQAEAENQVRLILNTPNLWQIAALNIAAILLAQRSPVHSDWAWQLLGYGEGRFGRHRGAVAQQMIHRFMPPAMKATPPTEVARLKQEGQQLEGQAIFADLLAALA